MSSGSLENVIYKICLEIIYLIYMYKRGLVSNNLQWLICHKTKPNQTKPIPKRGPAIICSRAETSHWMRQSAQGKVGKATHFFKK